MIAQSKSKAGWAGRVNRRAFTLIELLAVAMVILILAALMYGLAGYVQKRTAISTAKAQIAALGAALEVYKSDWGYYPATCPCRISVMGPCEATNNWILYQTLSGANGRKKYMTFPVGQVRPNQAGATNLFQAGSTNLLLAGFPGTVGGLTNFMDPWGMPYNYYRSPTTTFAVIAPTNISYAAYTLGGQVNLATYDLFSYGPDHCTYVPGGNTQVWAGNGWAMQWYGGNWLSPAAVLDDIANFGQ